jgi:osmotically-inducible protein OsmY
MKSDSDIKRDVEEELRFDPDIDATDIGVAVKDGVVSRWCAGSAALKASQI